jgi:hypothetical protein
MKRVEAAIAATRLAAPGYFESCLTQRTSGSGSSYSGLTPAELEVALVGASWEPYEHPDVMAGCSAFKAPLEGTFGLLDLSTVADDFLVTLADPKGTGFVEAECTAGRGGKVPFTVLILGQEKDVEVVFTFHPGDPIRPSRLPAEGRVGQIITAKEALALGFKWAKASA